MNHQITIILVVALVAVVVLTLVLLYLLRGRKQRVTLGDRPATLARAAAPTPPARAPSAPAPAVPATPPPSARDERHGVGSEVAAAIEDVVDQFVGLDAHPSGQGAVAAQGDVLTRLKGLGPKAASLLAELGVTSFAQIASWDAGDIAAIDARMGAFRGRIVRDRWVEQARLLAAGEIDAFEAEFGKLGG